MSELLQAPTKEQRAEEEVEQTTPFYIPDQEEDQTMKTLEEAFMKVSPIIYTTPNKADKQRYPNSSPDHS